MFTILNYKLKRNLCSSNLVNNSPSEPIQTIDIYKTRCTVVIEGKADGTGLASAAMNCSGPGAPVAVLGSADLNSLSANFRVSLPAHPFISVHDYIRMRAELWAISSLF